MSGGEAEKAPALAQRLISAQEEERQRIARVLHDDLGQQIASLSILMSTLKRRLPEQEAESADRIRDKLIALAESMQVLCHELYPTLLEHAGLAVAMRALCNEASERSGASIPYRFSGDFEGVPLPIALCLYRVAQDVLRVLIPGRGLSISVWLTRADNRIDIEFEATEGTFGFLMEGPHMPGAAAAEADQEGRLKLAEIRERAKLIAADVQVEPDRLTVSVAVA